MCITLRKKDVAKKVLAVTSAVAILTAGGTPIMPMLNMVPTVYAASTSATELLVYDMDNNTVGDKAEFTRFNTEGVNDCEYDIVDEGYDSLGRPIFTKREVLQFKVKSNSKDDKLLAFLSTADKKVTDFIYVDGSKGDYTVTVILSEYAGTYSSDTATNQTRKRRTLAAGDYTLTFTTESGNVYRTAKLHILKSVESGSFKINGVTTKLEGYKFNASDNFDGEVTGHSLLIQNHDEQLAVTMSNKNVPLKYSIVNEDGTKSSLANISAAGLITPKKAGTAYIKVESNDRLFGIKSITVKPAISLGTITIDDKEKVITASSELTYTQYLPFYIPITVVKENPVKSMTFTNAPDELEKGKSVVLGLNKVLTYNDNEHATEATDVVTWSTTNEKVITVNSSGKITAKGVGVATIRATGENGKVYCEREIKVYTKAISIIVPSNTSLYVGDSIDVEIALSPTTASEDVEWRSSNTNISISEIGIDGNIHKATIKGTKVGTSIITVKGVKSGVEKSFMVDVVAKPVIDKVDILFNLNGEETVTKKRMYVYNGQKVVLTGRSFAGEQQISDDEIKWSVTNKADAIAYKVNDKNQLEVSAVANGQAIIRATSKSNGVNYGFYFNVLRAADTITLTTENGKTKYTDIVGKKMQLTATLTTKSGQEHDDKIIKWTSDDESIATVSDTGLVETKSLGTTKIRVYTASGKQVTLTVEVVGVSQIKFNNISNEVLEYALSEPGKTTKVTVNVYNAKGGLVSVMPTWSSSDKSVATIDKNGVITMNKMGTTTITAKIGNISASIKLVVKIPMSACEFEEIPAVDYNPTKTTFNVEPVVKYEGNALKKGTDYTLSYSANTKPGTATVKITGKGNFSGTVNKTYKINQYVISANNKNIAITGIKDGVYTGEAIKQNDIVVKVQGVLLEKDVDYRLTYSNNKSAGTATVTIRGINKYTGYVAKSFKIVKADISKATIVMNNTVFDYNGKVQKPTVTVTQDGVQLPTSCYSVKIPDSTAVGYYTVTVTGKGDYDGTKTAQYRIRALNPSKITINKTEQTLGVGEKIRFSYTIANVALVKNTGVRWYSSNSNVATVDANGNVTAKTAGVAYINVVSTANSSIKSYCKLTVQPAPTKIRMYFTSGDCVSKVYNNDTYNGKAFQSLTTLTVKKGQEFTLCSAVNENSCSVNRTWTIANTNVVKFTNSAWNRGFKALNVGTTTVTIKTHNGKTATVQVKVIA